MFTESLRRQSKSIPVVSPADWSAFLQKELPQKKSEEWKYTDISFLDRQNFETDLSSGSINVSLISKDSLSLEISRDSGDHAFPQLKGLTIARRDEALALLKSAHADLVAGSWIYSNYFTDLFDVTNVAPVYFIFDPSWDSKNVLDLQFVASANPHVLSSLGIKIIVLPNVNVQIHEVFKGMSESLLNVSTKYFLCENSQLTLFKLDQTEKGRVMSTLRGRVAKNARLHAVHFTADALWARHNAYVELAGEAAHAELSASYLGSEGHFVDHHTFIDHKVGYTTSNQEYSGVLAAKSTGVFNGKVWIQRDAQKSNAEQISRNLLLSKTAEANAKPELLIDADDVKAKHGATIGQMDQEELFYMQSRGLTPAQSREMVLKSFVFASADKLPEALKNIYFSKVNGEIARFIAELKNV